jgi:hypothetical protein
MKLTSLLCGLAAGMLAATQIPMAAGDIVLSKSRMATAFGGNPAPNAECCLQINNCTLQNPTSCKNFNNNATACASGQQQTVQSQYARNCQAPNPVCPRCGCANFQTDSNGKSYYCIAVFNCSFDSILGTCNKGAANNNACTTGYYSCADSCPKPI